MSAKMHHYLTIWCDHDLGAGFTCNESFQNEGNATDGKFVAEQEGWTTDAAKWFCPAHPISRDSQ